MRLALCAVLLIGCSAGRSSVEVSLEGQAQGVTEVDLTVDNGGMTSSPVRYSLPAAVDIPPAQTLALQFDSTRRGAITIQVRALGSAGVVATGSGSGTISPGAQASAIHVELMPSTSSPPDMGAPDMIGGPSLTGAFVAGAGSATQGSVTLNGRFYWQGPATQASSGGVTLTGWFQ